MTENGDDQHSHAVRLIDVAARLCQFAASMIEIQSLRLNADHWADKIQREARPPAVAAWKSEPDIIDRFKAALTAVFEGRLVAERTDGTQLDKQHRPYTQKQGPSRTQSSSSAALNPYGEVVHRETSPYEDESRPPRSDEAVSLSQRYALKRASLASRTSKGRYIDKFVICTRHFTCVEKSSTRQFQQERQASIVFHRLRRRYLRRGRRKSFVIISQKAKLRRLVCASASPLRT